jgi:predicted secreted protein
MTSTHSAQVLQRLSDERSNRVIFVSHCLLNEHTRYAGGAFRQGSVDELVDGFQREGLGIVQMRCPEQCAWGGVRKPYILPVYGARGTALYPSLVVLFPLFLLYTRMRYHVFARSIAREIADYVRSGTAVVGIVGVGGSPSCGVWTTLDLRRSVDSLASCPVAQLNRDTMNEQAIVACRRRGQGMFTEALRRHLAYRRLSVSWYEHDLLNEIRGQPALLQPGE